MTFDEGPLQLNPLAPGKIECRYLIAHDQQLFTANRMARLGLFGKFRTPFILCLSTFWLPKTGNLDLTSGFYFLSALDFVPGEWSHYLGCTCCLNNPSCLHHFHSSCLGQVLGNAKQKSTSHPRLISINSFSLFSDARRQWSGAWP
jgi:hypothetical protein